ncbi:MAG: aldo/keto reductase [Nitrososphaeria archaeon]
MEYRQFGKLDWKVSALGFGGGRFPVIGSDKSKINEDQAIKMIRYAIDHGVNYLDSGYEYHRGNSETLIGKALRDGYRQKAKVATKMPVWLVNSQSDMTRILNEQLIKLQSNHIDFYLLHGLKRDRWLKMKQLNVIDWAERAIEEGKITHFGFSFHDDYEVFKEIVDDYDKWDLCQIQYNYLDQDFQAGTRGLRYAASKKIAVVVMEPIAAGMLALKPSKDTQNIWDKAETKKTPAELALQWVWDHPEVSVALSGMSAMEQVIENIGSASRSKQKKLTKKELKLISELKKKHLEGRLIGCRDCGYCMPCPQGVDIPKNLAFYNEFGRFRFGNEKALKELVARYNETVPAENRATECAKCGQCEDKCPQQLPIRNLLAEVVIDF